MHDCTRLWKKPQGPLRANVKDLESFPGVVTHGNISMQHIGKCWRAPAGFQCRPRYSRSSGTLRLCYLNQGLLHCWPREQGQERSFHDWSPDSSNLEYIKFVQQFYLSNAQINSVLDITNIGIGLAATLVGPAVTKSILAAVATGLTGARLSIERNFFQEKTIQVLVTQMNAQRTAALVPIQRGLTQSVEQYPLALAIVDLNAYYEAGTIQGAIIGIQVSAGQLQATAEQDLARLRDIKSEPDQSSAILKRWLFPGFATEDATGRFLDVSGKPAAADPTRLTQLRDWLNRNGFDVPIGVLLRAPQLASTRTKIISDLKVRGDQTEALLTPQLTARKSLDPLSLFTSAGRRQIQPELTRGISQG